jgi:hypothetical protein
MPWEYKYDGPAETEIKSMKEVRSSDSVEYISDESGDDVEEHGEQDRLSNFNDRYQRIGSTMDAGMQIFHLAFFMSSSQRIHKTLFLISNKSHLAVQNLMSIP